MSNRRRWILLSLVIISGVINYADRQIIALLKPMIETDFRMTDEDYGHITSMFQFATAVSLLFAGWFVDFVGIKRANSLVVAAWSVAGMAHGFIRSLLQMAGARIALGFTEAPYTPLAVKSISLLCRPAERSLAFGAMNAAGTVGAILTPFLVPPLAAILGWRSAFVIIGAAGLVWVAVWMLFSRFIEMDPAGSAPKSSALSWGEALRDRRTWAVAGAKILSDQVWWLLLYWAPDLFRRLFHLSATEIALPIGIMYSFSIAGSLLGGVLSRTLLLKGYDLNRVCKLTLLGCALLATPIALVDHVGQAWMAVALLGLTLFAHQGFSVNLFTLIADIVPKSRLATVTGIGVLAGNLGGMGILYLTGWVLTRQGNYGPVFIIAALSYLVALLWIQMLLPVVRLADAEEEIA